MSTSPTGEPDPEPDSARSGDEPTELSGVPNSSDRMEDMEGGVGRTAYCSLLWGEGRH